MKRWVALSLLLIPLLASAESFWEGSAALQRGDATFESSLSAASNSFAPDTRVLVQNLDTGKSTEATVTQRADGQSDILILLSPRAADAIGMAAGTISRVRVTVLEKPAAASTAGSSEQAFNPDPDRNPAVGSNGEPVETAQAAEPAPSTAEGQAAEPAQAEQPAEQPEAAQQQAQAASPSAEDQQILAEAAARKPQKQLFLPPREDEKFTYRPAPVAPAQTAQAQQPEEPQAPQAPEAAASAAPEVPSVIGETGAPGSRQETVPLAEAQPQSASGPQEVAGAPARPAPGEAGAALALPEAGGKPATQTESSGTQPAPSTSGGAQVALSPPEAPPAEKPPEPAVKPPEPAVTTPEPAKAPQVAAAVPENPRAVEKPGTGVQTVAALPKLAGKKNAATFYLQLGAYASQEVALSMAGRLTPTYPVVVLAPASSGRQMYKVMVGPLNKAESGTLLPLFRYRGFRDAFVHRE